MYTLTCQDELLQNYQPAQVDKISLYSEALQRVWSYQPAHSSWPTNSNLERHCRVGSIHNALTGWTIRDHLRIKLHLILKLGFKGHRMQPSIDKIAYCQQNYTSYDKNKNIILPHKCYPKESDRVHTDWQIWYSLLVSRSFASR